MFHNVTTQAALNLLPATPKTVLYFSADWCGPCKFVKPVLETLAADRPDVTFVRVDVDAEGDLARIHGIRGIPTALVIEGDSAVIARLNGNAIASHIGNSI